MDKEIIINDQNEIENGISNKNPLEWIVGISTEHPGKILLVFLIITILFLIPTSQLQIDTSMEGFFGTENLPEEIEKFQEIGTEFGEQELVTVVVDCKDPDNSELAQYYLSDLAENLSKINDFKDIRYTSNTNLAGEKVILYLPQEHLYFLLDPNATTESVNGTYELIMTQMNQPSYYVSENGKLYLLNMILNGSIESAEQRTEIFDGLYKILEDVQDSNADYNKLDVGFTGSMAVIDYEGDKMAMEDVMITFVITFVLILILLFVSFRSISLPAFTLIPLIVGIIITAGIIQLTYGALNMAAAFFAVLLLGLGIDFGIHLLTRFTEEMNGENDVKAAFKKTSMNTGKAIVLGSVTTAVAFGALIFSKTGGMHQMGIVLAIGLIITMLSVLFLLPALVTLRLRRGKLKEKMQKKAKFNVLAKLGKVSKKYAAGFVIILIIFGIFIAIEAQNLEINEDIHELQPKTVPSYKQLEKVKENFNYTEDYLLVIAYGYDDLVRSVEGFQAIPEIMEIESILNYLPQNQSEKLTLIAQAKQLHPEFVDIDWLNIESMTWRDLPLEVQKNWVGNIDEPGNERFLIRIKAYGNVWADDYRKELLNDMEEVNPNISGRAVAFTVLIDVITDDVIWVSLFAVIPIFVIVYIGFRTRNPVYAILAMVPVLVGVGSILALSDYLSIDLNMISIMMIPLVIGIGIDDGIHILHRYKEEGKGSLPKVVQNTGKAVLLTTATTCLAFSSFLVASHPGMRPMGGTPVLGLIMAFIAAIIFLPALIALIIDGRKKKNDEKW
jgi:predicted RND superfamily exporter protein